MEQFGHFQSRIELKIANLCYLRNLKYYFLDCNVQSLLENQSNESSPYSHIDPLFWMC